MKVIRSEEDYREALARIAEVVTLDPEPGSEEGDELEILSILVEDYESKVYAVANPSPVEAIEFRMEQAGLTQRDLIPYIGSKSKVSEVLSGKRGLSVGMIRALSKGLGIPADVLIQKDDDQAEVEWRRLPVREMIARDWITSGEADDLSTLIQKWLSSFGWQEVAAFRVGAHVRSGRDMDEHSILAWTAWVARQAHENPPKGRFVKEVVTKDLLRQLAKLSVSEKGPLEAREFLSEKGIGFVVAEHLPRTYVDGALLVGDYPVVALTLRHDRIDSFWFTLMHELAHLICECGQSHFYLDDLDVEPQEECERQADLVAAEALVPRDEWLKSPASSLRTPEAAEHLAKRLGIHPAIVAGKIRHEFADYRKLTRMVGQGKVRALFVSTCSSGGRGDG